MRIKEPKVWGGRWAVEWTPHVSYHLTTLQWAYLLMIHETEDKHQTVLAETAKHWTNAIHLEHEESYHWMFYAIMDTLIELGLVRLKRGLVMLTERGREVIAAIERTNDDNAKAICTSSQSQ